MSDLFPILVAITILLVFVTYANMRRAGHWRTLYEGDVELREQTAVEREALAWERSQEPDWIQMVHPRYKETYYFEYGKPVDGSLEFGITRWGGTATLGMLNALYYDYPDLFGDVLDSGRSYRSKIHNNIEGMGVYVVTAEIWNRYSSRNTYYKYMRCFVTSNPVLAKAAKFLFDLEEERQSFQPPLSADNTGFDLETIDKVLSLALSYEASFTQQSAAQEAPVVAPVQTSPMGTYIPMPMPQSGAFSDEPSEKITYPQGVAPMPPMGKSNFAANYLAAYEGQ